MRKNKSESNSLHKNRENVLSNLFADLPELSFRGNREVVIEGSKGVLHYSEELVRINTSMGLLCFFGRNLNLKCISPTELIINGFILKVEFVV
ncbi:MAG: YabP/YqfC family sporulation protein [Ruminococcus sp.]|nr:YabP/YqfC family sporulation protein [Ruminococcus sp.]